VRYQADSPSLGRAQPRSGLRLLLGLALSLLLNLILFRLVDAPWLSEAAPQREVGLAPLAASDWERNRTVTPSPRLLPPPAAAVKPPPPERERVDPTGQVVDIGPARENEKSVEPKESRFLAERSSSVDKETRSRHQGIYERAAPRPTAKGEAAPEGLPEARPDAAPKQARQAVEQRRELALALSPLATLRLPQSREATPGEEGDKASTEPPAPGVRDEPGLPGASGAQRKLDLRPRIGLLADLSAGPAPDYLRDVQEGEGTFLNTREWKYAGFITRIGREVVPNWSREFRSALAARDPTGERYLYKDRETVVSIRLDPQGKLLDVRVVQSSGVPFLDEAVRKAWQESQPFSNVPAGLVDKGEVKLLWGYVVTNSPQPLKNLFLGPIGE
jgi:TonB family protein